MSNILKIIYLCLVFAIGVPGLPCSAMMQREPSLDEAAVLMYEFPDSAMAVVEKVEPRLAMTRYEEDEKADSAANTVFNYYRKHGSRQEKFDVYYILGRYHQLRGNEEVAMFCYISAGQYAGDAAGSVLPGCLYSSMASLFEYGFDYAKAAEYYSRSGDCFFEGRNYQYYTEACIRAARCYLANNPLLYERWAEMFGEMRWWEDVRRLRIGQQEAEYYKTVSGPCRDNTDFRRASLEKARGSG